MDEKSVGLQSIDYRQVFPWIHLFRAFWIAVDVRKLILAGLALVVLAVGDWAFWELPFAPKAEDAGPVHWPWTETFSRTVHPGTIAMWTSYPLVATVESVEVEPSEDLAETSPFDTVRDLSQEPWRIASFFTQYAHVLLQPLRGLFDPGSTLFKSGGTWSEVAYAWTRLLWVLAVWALFGGAITRMAAVQFARDERIGMLDALSYAGGRFLSYFSAPLLPIAGFGLFWALCVAAGWIGRIPVAGEAVIGLLWIVPLFLGLVMALILIGVAVGWPLMLTTISVEGSDAFDGFSRAYSYVYNRPWHLLWYVIVALVYGSALIFFVLFMTSLIVYLAGWGVAAGLGPQSTSALFQGAPELVGGAGLLAETDGIQLRTEPGMGGLFAGVWLQVMTALLVGFVYSYFWTTSTIIYLLLRHGDDGADLDAVYIPEEQDRDELLPLVGVAASDQPLIERPATSDTAPAAPHDGEASEEDSTRDSD